MNVYQVFLIRSWHFVAGVNAMQIKVRYAYVGLIHRSVLEALFTGGLFSFHPFPGSTFSSIS